MADVMTVEQRSRVMSRIRGKDTLPERYLNELLVAGGLTFTRHEPSIHGKPDFVFGKSRAIVFVDGDFWHGWRFPLWKHRLASFWREKIEKNRARDQRNFRRLRRAGWKVLRLWEHEVEDNARSCAVRIATFAGESIDISKVDSRIAALPVLKRRKRLPKP